MLLPASCTTNSISVSSIGDSDALSDNDNNNDDKNPGGIGEDARTLLSYNGENFEFDRCIIRVVLGKDNKIIEPQEKDWDSEIKETMQALKNVNDLEYLGTGDVLGTNPSAKLYMMTNGNILALRPCEIEPYTDAEEMLEKYSADEIFEVNTFIKVIDYVIEGLDEQPSL